MNPFGSPSAFHDPRLAGPAMAAAAHQQSQANMMQMRMVMHQQRAENELLQLRLLQQQFRCGPPSPPSPSVPSSGMTMMMSPPCGGMITPPRSSITPPPSTHQRPHCSGMITPPESSAQHEQLGAVSARHQAMIKERLHQEQQRRMQAQASNPRTPNKRHATDNLGAVYGLPTATVGPGGVVRRGACTSPLLDDHEMAAMRMPDTVFEQRCIGTSNLVKVDDRDLVPDALLMAMSQMIPCQFTQDDRIGCYKTRKVGYTGMCCKHCGGEPGFGRYFPNSVRSLAQTTTSQTILKHISSKCKDCPPEIRQAVIDLQRQQAVTLGRKLRYGSRKIFFQRMWQRLHGKQAGNSETSDEQGAEESNDDDGTTSSTASVTASSNESSEDNTLENVASNQWKRKETSQNDDDDDTASSAKRRKL